MKNIKEEKWAKLFHNTYEQLAPSFGYETRTDTKVFDPESKNGKLMIEVCNRVIDQALTARDEEWKNKIEQYKWKYLDIRGINIMEEVQELATKAHNQVLDDLINSMK